MDRSQLRELVKASGKTPPTRTRSPLENKLRNYLASDSGKADLANAMVYRDGQLRQMTADEALVALLEEANAILQEVDDAAG